MQEQVLTHAVTLFSLFASGAWVSTISTSNRWSCSSWMFVYIVFFYSVTTRLWLIHTHAMLIGVPLSFFTSKQPYANHAITEHLTLVRVKNRFINKCIRFLMGSVTFPAVHLPTTAANSQTTFKLWGLTLGMTSDIIEFTKKNHLAFLKLTKSKPVYSRKDIGMLAALITQMRYFVRYGKMELDPNSSAMRYVVWRLARKR